MVGPLLCTRIFGNNMVRGPIFLEFWFLGLELVEYVYEYLHVAYKTLPGGCSTLSGEIPLKDRELCDKVEMNRELRHTRCSHFKVFLLQIGQIVASYVTMIHSICSTAGDQFNDSVLPLRDPPPM